MKIFQGLQNIVQYLANGFSELLVEYCSEHSKNCPEKFRTKVGLLERLFLTDFHLCHYYTSDFIQAISSGDCS